MTREARGETRSATENFHVEATRALPACLSGAKASYVVTYKFKRKGICRKIQWYQCSENKHNNTRWTALLNSIMAGSQIYEGDSDIRRQKLTHSYSTLMIVHIYWAATLFQSQLLLKLPFIPYLMAWILGPRF